MSVPTFTIPTVPSARTESISQAQQRIADELRAFQDWSDCYDYLVEVGRRLPPMPPALRTEPNRLRNCHGHAWLAGEHRGNRLYLAAASDTAIIAGLLAVVVEIYSGRSPADIIHEPPSVFETAGLTKGLSPHRQAALAQILENLQMLAMDGNERVWSAL